MGAGFLPVSLHNNRLYFLFGEEDKERKWSDFGGGKNDNETPLSQFVLNPDFTLNNSLNKGYEETNGILGTMSDIKELLKHNTLLKVGIEHYTTFIVKIGYDEALPYYFNNQQKFIKTHFPNLIDKNGFFEKRQMKWMTINDMKTKRKYFRGHYKYILDHIIKNERYLLEHI